MVCEGGHAPHQPTGDDRSNDRIATQRYLTPEILIGSPVMSRTTSEPSGRRSRKMVAIVAGCRSTGNVMNCPENQ